MAKKNLLTDKEAEQILKRLKKSAKPSERLKKHVHNVLLKDAHILFQYKNGNTRYGYCTGCGKDFVIEIKAMRTYTDNDVDVLTARHNEKVTCPCCGRTVTKRYARYSRKDMYANAAEFKVDKSGALIVYVYRFTYRFSDNFRNEPDWHCWQIGYFDLHKYFHMLYGWNGPRAYTGDRYTNEILFTNKPKVESPFDFSQIIKCFELQKAVEKSNLKYACLDKYMGSNSVKDMFRYLNFYCSYPEITEKLMKEGYEDDIMQYLFGNLSGCFNVRAKNVPGFFKLDKTHLKTLREYKHYYGRDEIRAMQYMQNNRMKLTYGVFNFISSNYRNIDLIRRLQDFMGMQKLIKYVEKQGALCVCQHYYGTIEHSFFSNYEDYIQQCEIISLGQALTNCIFSERECAFGNSIIFYPKDIAFMSMENKLSALQVGLPAGIFTKNEARELLGYPPVEGGDAMPRGYNELDDSTQTKNDEGDNRTMNLKRTFNYGETEREIRFATFAMQADSDPEEELVIEGYAAVFESETLIGELPWGFYEKIDKKAFDGVDMSDVPLKYNHSDTVPILARTRNKSLELSVDEKGLKVRATLLDTQDARDMYKRIKAGLLDKMSFAFTIKEEIVSEDEDGTIHRCITAFDRIFDVAIVDLPAYDDTEISVGSRKKLESWKGSLESEKQRMKKQCKKTLDSKTRKTILLYGGKNK